MAKMKKNREQALPFKSVNYILFIIALVMIVLGFFFLDKGSMTMAPLILVIAYCVILPVAIMWGGRKDEGKKADLK